jgi:tRNA pseudouridine55 synthase
MDGILILDKPAGRSSAQALARVKRLLKADKAGHTGTLDPFATGVLVCCLGRATRLARFFTHGRKRYEAALHLGIDTDTQDFTGAVLSEKDASNVALAQIGEVFARFTGVIEQAPPVYSALKHKGVPLYKLARRGEPVRKPARTVEIFHIRVLRYEPPLVFFETECSGGTYIRTLCADAGRELGCGGHLAALRRTENNGFSISAARTLEEMEALVLEGRAEEALISMTEALEEMPGVVAGPELQRRVGHGMALTWKDIGGAPREGSGGETPTAVKITDGEGRLLAVLEADINQGSLSYCCVFQEEPDRGKKRGGGASAGHAG